MFAPMFKPHCFTPIAPLVMPCMPRPVMRPIMPFNCMPSIPIMPTMPRMSTMAMPSPMSFSTNIFVQYMMNFVKSCQNSIMNFTRYLPKIPQVVTPKYKFGTLTSPIQYKATNTQSNSNLGLRITNVASSALQKLGYCASSGLRLAKTALSSAVGFTGYCAKYVKNAIARAGLGSYVGGHAYDMVRILRNNKNFKEISVSGADLKKLPAGCILVYGRGVSGYSSRYGHTEITTGDGRAVSDGITRNIRGNVTAVFMPVA